MYILFTWLQWIKIRGCLICSYVCRSDFDFCSFEFQAAGQSQRDFVTFGQLDIVMKFKRGGKHSISNSIFEREIFSQYFAGKIDGSYYSLDVYSKKWEYKMFGFRQSILEDVVINLIKLKLHTPNIIKKGLNELIRRCIAKLFQFCVNKVQLPINLNITCLMLFLASKQDSLIPQYHFDNIQLISRAQEMGSFVMQSQRIIIEFTQAMTPPKSIHSNQICQSIIR
ncbi:unnamed protein product [Paramecium primaurelia]|uniref:Uncharacterized protein n=1 Tax=Paramecium primaurelia TaxID=5886 RepID=A0A8S1QI26_PARPR|nr:unnamed protein product [Paramecium primaurelia]